MSSNTVILVKRSGVSGNTPSVLDDGEIALNYADGKIFYKNDINVISSIENQNTFSTINVDSVSIVASSTTDTLSFVSGDNIVISSNAVSKTITINSTSDHLGNLLTTNASANQILDMYEAGTYRTAKYTIQALSGTQVHSCEAILTHNDIKTTLSQYGIVKTNRFNLFTLDSGIVSGNVVLYITPVNANTQVDYTRTSIISRSLPV